ncbi:hypothetical protein LTR78_000311 [Recurvomyces mirabilis]|uniref:BTB domain-containing protein n=1 Tax=Recurvomyces mirabilis TaxID=574656 RepID=A0AAE0WXN2_9PEZI|nr:hypothetical protein LTR78_000311 [Recurvomyces mirabilis]KAK5161966.1 hypothetical protein LTS14_000312 [Recurvomyces mirabilis]
MASEPARKKARLEYRYTFTVLVGDEEKPFVLHATIASAKSPFFDAACNGQFKESQAKELLCLKRIRRSLGHLFKDQDADHGAYTQWGYARLYTLASMLLDVKLQNQVVDDFKAFLLVHNKGPTMAALHEIYQNGPAGSTLQRYVMDWYANHCAELSDFFQKHRAQFPSAFLGDVLIRVSKAKHEKVPNPNDLAPCHYHEHNDEVPKCPA